MDKINFSKATADHVIWNVRLRCFLDGDECITEKQAISQYDCTLGKWLYAEGMSKYRMVSEVQELERWHADLHSTVRSVIQMKELGRISDAEERLTRLKFISEKIIFLIGIIEIKIKLDKKKVQNNE